MTVGVIHRVRRSQEVVVDPQPDTRPLLPSCVLAAVTAGVLWIGVYVLRHTGGVGSGIEAGSATLLAPALFALVGFTLVCERLWPADRRPLTARGHLHDAGFFALHIIVVVPLMILLSTGFARVLGGPVSGIGRSLTGHRPYLLLSAVTFVLMDGANWLAHWADHRFRTLWRMHALHHSQEELSVLTSFRAHPLSHLPGFLLAAVPVGMVMGARGAAPALITTYVCLGTLSHANTRWTYGPIGRFVVSPPYHRLHHSIDYREGVNLGIVLTVWDVLARRARFPVKSGPVIPTGLSGRPVSVEQATYRLWDPKILVMQLVEPFTGHSGATNSRRVGCSREP